MDEEEFEQRFARHGGARPPETSTRPEHTRRADLRYGGQSFEITVDAGSFEKLEDRFHAAHEQRYGYRMDDETVELVNLRLDLHRPRRETRAARSREPEDDAEAGAREANFDGEWLEVPVLDREKMGEGSEVAGPAIVEFKESTCVVRPGWRGTVDGVGTLVLEREMSEQTARPGNPVRAGERAGGHSGGDGGGPDPGLLLLEHQGAARLLHGALRRGGPDGRPGRAHARPPRRDARGGGGHHGAATPSPATSSPSTTRTRAAPTCRT